MGKLEARSVVQVKVPFINQPVEGTKYPLCFVSGDPTPQQNRVYFCEYRNESAPPAEFGDGKERHLCTHAARFYIHGCPKHYDRVSSTIPLYHKQKTQTETD